jgi:hypothetical protein
VPDQSLSNEAVSGKTGQEAGNPADTSANDPAQATPESQESNVNRASEGETQQADVTINQDPVVASGDAQTAGADDYDNEEAWPYRKLQAHAKETTGDGSGKRDEIVARLRAQASGGGDSSQNLGADTTDADPADPAPRGAVDPTNVENGGIQRTGRGQEHAEILQGLSNDRRKAQLAAVADRSNRSGGDED